MSFLNSPQYASVTTRLLEAIDEVMPRRHRYILAAIVAFVTLGSAATTIGDWRARAGAAPPPPIIVIATPRMIHAPASGGQGLARKLPMASVLSPATVPTLAPPVEPSEPSVEQPAAIFVALPAPTLQPPATPTLVPSPVATVPVTVYTWRSDGTLLSVYQCKPYGDWRDTDPMYVHPECAPQR